MQAEAEDLSNSTPEVCRAPLDFQLNLDFELDLGICRSQEVTDKGRSSRNFLSIGNTSDQKSLVVLNPTTVDKPVSFQIQISF